MKQIKNNYSLINIQEHLGYQQKDNRTQMMQQQDILNHDFYKTATFFDPNSEKQACAVEQSQKNRHFQEQTVDILKQPQSTFNPTQNLDNQNGTFFPKSINSFKLNQNYPQESTVLDKKCKISNLSPVQQSLHSSLSDKRSILGFKLSTCSTNNEHENDFDSIQQIQDEDFWNKVKMIISEKDEKNKINKEKLIILPTINQKDESTKKQDKNQNKRLQNNLQSMSSGLDIGHKNSYLQQSKSNSLLQNQPHLNYIKSNYLNAQPYQKYPCFNHSSSNAKKQQICSTLQNYSSQIPSLQLDSIKTEESTNINSPESSKYFASPYDSFYPSQINSEQLSTNANSTISAEQISNSSQSLSFLNSQHPSDQQSLNQPNLLNIANSRSEVKQIINYLSNKLPYEDLGNQHLKTIHSVQTEPSEYENEFIQHKESLYLPKQYHQISQQKLKRINFSSQSQNALYDPVNMFPQKSQNKQSQKLLNYFKNDERNIQQENLKRREYTQNILFEKNPINQLNGSIKKKQFDCFQTLTDRKIIDDVSINNLTNKQLLKPNEDNTCPVFTNSSQSSQHLISQQNDKNKNQITRMNYQTFIFDNYQLRGDPSENDFSFSDDGTIKISQSAQSCRDQAKKINLRSKQQENLVKKLFKIDDKSQQQVKNNLFQNYLNIDSTQLKQKKRLSQYHHQ